MVCVTRRNLKRLRACIRSKWHLKSQKCSSDHDDGAKRADFHPLIRSVSELSGLDLQIERLKVCYFFHTLWFNWESKVSCGTVRWKLFCCSVFCVCVRVAAGTLWIIQLLLPPAQFPTRSTHPDTHAASSMHPECRNDSPHFSHTFFPYLITLTMGMRNWIDWLNKHRVRARVRTNNAEATEFSNLIRSSSVHN